ncbi:MAG: endonuclease/exonuclease/phosphatase family protein [Acidimicrobiales bacterium]|jgi:endonuclease/exonuclease/phosphatase family metal-dependent hydrolase
MAEFVVATFNIHAGVDGWGRPFDVVASCEKLDADVLVLEEAWTPEGEEGIAASVAAALGYEAHQAHLSDALLTGPPTTPGVGWGPRRGGTAETRRLRVAGAEELGRLPTIGAEGDTQKGEWGIALLSRLPVRRVEAVELGQLSRDRGKTRAVIVAEVTVGASVVTVAGTHLAHFVHGSPILVARLRQSLPHPSEPGVLLGDMNFWGPPLSLAFPGWRRAVRARTYPSWRAHSQIDHIFVTRAVQVVSGDSPALGNSDHRPLRATLAIA